MSKKLVTYNGVDYQRPTGVQLHGNSIRIEFRFNKKIHKATVFTLQPIDNVQRRLDESGELYLKVLMLQRDGLFTDEAYRKLLPNSAFARGKGLVNLNPSLNDVIKKFLAAQEPLSKCGEVKVSTFRNEKKTLLSKRYLGPVPEAQDKVLRTKGLGEMSLTNLNVALLEEYRNVLLSRKLAHKTINNIITHLRSAGFHAVKLRLLTENPFSKLELLKIKRPRRPVIFSMKELEDIRRASLEINKEWLGNMAIFGTWTGLRLEELLGLAWQDIDLKNGTMHVQRSFTYDSFGDLKTDGSNRIVTLYPQALEMLNAQRRWTADAKPQTITVIAGGGAIIEEVTLVFQNLEPHGPIPRHFTSGGLRKQWNRLRKIAEVNKPMKQLRHTFASRLISAGASAGLVASIMGHRTTKMVDTIYGGFFEDYGRLHSATVLANLTNAVPALELIKSEEMEPA